jgi:1-acyl-sn-glycerol-3-phosphate acyltransferase
VLRILGIKLTLKDAWPFKEDEARVVIINHQSTLDIIWFCAICPNRPGAVGKRELIWIPFINLGWWAFRLFLIDRSNREVAIQTMKAATENTIKYRRSVSLAPEGTRSKDARILPFKKGVFHLAMEGRLPIYPVVMCGAAEAMPKHTFWAYPRPISLRFLPPISTEEWTRETLDEEIEAIRAQMVTTYEALRAEEGLPPL